jgi:hypothetical protein
MPIDCGLTDRLGWVAVHQQNLGVRMHSIPKLLNLQPAWRWSSAWELGVEVLAGRVSNSRNRMHDGDLATVGGGEVFRPNGEWRQLGRPVDRRSKVSCQLDVLQRGGAASL